MIQPLISIITVNYNNKAGLINTINSVLAQSFKRYEFIVIDGLSTDGSKEVLQENDQYIHYWVSEKDQGIYDAMNKGVQKATGKYLFFLNSGDRFASNNVLEKVGLVMEQENYGVVFGNVFLHDKQLITYKSTLSLYYVLNQGMCHQVQFLKKALFDEAGLYNLNYPVTADHCQLILFLVKYKASYKHIPIAISILEPGGKSFVSLDNNANERLQFMQIEFPMLLKDYLLLKRYEKINLFKRVKNFVKRKLAKKKSNN